MIGMLGWLWNRRHLHERVLPDQPACYRFRHNGWWRPRRLDFLRTSSVGASRHTVRLSRSWQPRCCGSGLSSAICSAPKRPARSSKRFNFSNRTLSLRGRCPETVAARFSSCSGLHFKDRPDRIAELGLKKRADLRPFVVDDRKIDVVAVPAIRIQHVLAKDSSCVAPSRKIAARDFWLSMSALSSTLRHFSTSKANQN